MTRHPRPAVSDFRLLPLLCQESLRGKQALKLLWQECLRGKLALTLLCQESLRGEQALKPLCRENRQSKRTFSPPPRMNESGCRFCFSSFCSSGKSFLPWLRRLTSRLRLGIHAAGSARFSRKFLRNPAEINGHIRSPEICDCRVVVSRRSLLRLLSSALHSQIHASRL